MTDRATRELVALMVAGTVCLIVVGSGLALVILKLATPEIDIGPAGQTWASMPLADAAAAAAASTVCKSTSRPSASR